MAEPLTRRHADEVTAKKAGLLQGWRDRRRRERQGMEYLERCHTKVITVYLPIALFLIVLLFPFYWMSLTSIKPNNELIDMNDPQSLVGRQSDARAFPQAPVRDRLSALDVEHHVRLGQRDHPVAGRERDGRLRDRARALPGLEHGRRHDLPRLSGAALDPVHPARDHRLPVPPVRQPARADPDLSDHPDPVLDLALDGLLQDHPLRARGMRPDRRRRARPDPDQDHPAARRSRA